jgi:hypothetical protein
MTVLLNCFFWVFDMRLSTAPAFSWGLKARRRNGRPVMN